MCYIIFKFHSVSPYICMYLFVNMYGWICVVYKHTMNCQVKMCLAICAASMRVRFATWCILGSVTGTVLQKNKYKGSSNKN